MDKKETRFKEIYETNYPKVIRLCLGYVNGDTQKAADIAQEVFIKTWENLENFREDSKVSTWIYRIAVNTCLLQIRKDKKTAKKYPLHRLVEAPVEVNEIEKENMLNGLYACITMLSETNKAIIMLELEGLPQKEIAKVMGLQHEAIRTRIHRIKNKLIKCVNHE